MRSGEVTTVCHIQCSNIHPIWPIWVRHKNLADPLLEPMNTPLSLLATPTSFSCYTTVRTFLDTCFLICHVCVCTPIAMVIEQFGRQHFTCYSFLGLARFSPSSWFRLKTTFPSKYLGPGSCCLDLLIWIPKHVILPGLFRIGWPPFPASQQYLLPLVPLQSIQEALGFRHLRAHGTMASTWPVNQPTSKPPRKAWF